MTGAHRTDRSTLRLPFDTLTLAGEALSHGNMLGAIMHARLAIMQRATFDAVRTPANFMDRLIADPRLAGKAPVLHLMEELAGREFRGEHIDLSIAILLAPRAISLAQKLCFHTPDIIRRALGIDQANADEGLDSTSGMQSDSPVSSGDEETEPNG